MCHGRNTGDLIPDDEKSQQNTLCDDMVMNTSQRKGTESEEYRILLLPAYDLSVQSASASPPPLLGSL
jgi:hypothetical protein